MVASCTNHNAAISSRAAGLAPAISHVNIMNIATDSVIPHYG